MMKTNTTKKAEKKCFFIFLLLICSYLCNAQLLSGGRDRLETIKMSYITKKLNLSDKEAQKFWVIYPQYLKDLSTVRHNCPNDAIKREEGILDVRKKCRNQMIPILKDSQRVNEVFTLEKNYREMLRKELRKRVNTTDSSK